MISTKKPFAPQRRKARLRAGFRIVALVSPLVVAFAAQAADIDDGSFLRGAFAPVGLKPFNSWDGPYFGADLGRSRLNADFSDNISEMIARLLRNTTIENEAQVSKLPSVQGSGTGNLWGGFVGYNWQTTDLVLGIEGAYHMASKPIQASGSDSIGRSFTTSGGTNYDVTIDSHGRLELKDYATIRGRAGYVVGQFLPYAGLGLSVARVSYDTSAAVVVVQNSVPPVTLNQTVSTHKENAVAYGANLALGVDVTLLPNMFLRGEFEYIAFAPVDRIRSNINTFRVGLGLKF